MPSSKKKNIIIPSFSNQEMKAEQFVFGVVQKYQTVITYRKLKLVYKL